MVVTEKCPSCGKTMESGYLVSAKPINWCTEVPKVSCQCGKCLSTGSIWTCQSVVGYRCKGCQIIKYIKKKNLSK